MLSVSLSSSLRLISSPNFPPIILSEIWQIVNSLYLEFIAHLKLLISQSKNCLVPENLLSAMSSKR